MDLDRITDIAVVVHGRACTTCPGLAPEIAPVPTEDGKADRLPFGGVTAYGQNREYLQNNVNFRQGRTLDYWPGREDPV